MSQDIDLSGEQFAGQALESKQSFGLPLTECQDVDFLRSAVETLWQLLDDIDTAGDMFKPQNLSSYKSYDNFITIQHKKRFNVLESDGYNLFLPINYAETGDG